MAEIKKITYEDKIQIEDDPSVLPINKVRDVDLNEIKNVVNNNADELDTSNVAIEQNKNNIDTINGTINNLVKIKYRDYTYNNGFTWYMKGEYYGYYTSFYIDIFQETKIISVQVSFTNLDTKSTYDRPFQVSWYVTWGPRLWISIKEIWKNRDLDFLKNHIKVRVFYSDELPNFPGD